MKASGPVHLLNWLILYFASAGIPYGPLVPVPAPVLPIQLRACGMGKSEGWAKALGFISARVTRKKAPDFWLLASDRLNSSHCDHLGS